MIITITLLLGVLLMVAQLYLIWITAKFSIYKVWPDKSKALSTKTGDFVLDLVPVGKYYTGQLTVGYPFSGKEEQTFNVAYTLSTGRCWVASLEACPNRNCNNMGFKGFDGTVSQSYTKIDENKMDMPFDNIKMQVILVEDQLKIGRGMNSIVLPKQKFAEVIKADGLQGYDGLFGLSLVTATQFYEQPVWNLIRNLRIEPVFSFFLTNDQDLPSSKSKLIFGGKDEDLWIGDLNSHEVVKQNNEYTGWLINIDKIALVFPTGGRRERVDLSVKVATLALEERGIALPKADFDKITTQIFQNSKIPHNDRYEIDCNSDLTELPMVIIVIDGKEYVLTPSEYKTELDESSSQYPCGSGFKVGSQEQKGTIVLGQSFMKKYYTRFHLEKKQVQFAEAKHTNMGDPTTKRY